VHLSEVLSALHRLTSLPTWSEFFRAKQKKQMAIVSPSAYFFGTPVEHLNLKKLMRNPATREQDFNPAV